MTDDVNDFKNKLTDTELMDLIKVSSAKYLNDYIVEFEFTDGVSGKVDLKDEIYGEVFHPLKDIDYFKSFTRDRWTIGWDCGADFSPEFLHKLTIEQNVKAHNKV